MRKLDNKLQSIKEEVATLESKQIAEVQQEMRDIMLDAHVKTLKQKYLATQQNNTITVEDDDNEAYDECFTF